MTLGRILRPICKNLVCFPLEFNTYLVSEDAQLVVWDKEWARIESGKCSARSPQSQRCGGRQLLRVLVFMFGSLSKKTFIKLPLDRLPPLNLLSTAYRSLVADFSLIANNPFVNHSSLVNSSLVADCSIHSIHTCHVDIDAENQGRWGILQGERDVDLCRREDMRCAVVEKKW